MTTGLKCPKGHSRIWKKGVTPTRKGEKQRYICFVCGRTFYAPGDKFRKPKKRKE